MNRLTDDQGDGDLGVLLDGGGDVVDVGLVLVKTILSYLVLAVGRKSRAVTVGQVVDDEGAHDGWVGAGGILCLDVGEVGVYSGNLCGVVTEIISMWYFIESMLVRHSQPYERAEFGDSAGLGLQAGRERGDRKGVDLRGVVRVGVDLLASEGVA